MRRLSSQVGQASVELVAVLPFVLIVAAMLWQAVVAGEAAWRAGSAVRVAARAHAVGADPAAAARRALPRSLRRALSVKTGHDGAVRLAVGVPAILGRGMLLTLHATARFAPQAP